MKNKPWKYGDPPPKNYHEAADAVKSVSGVKSKRKNPLEDRLNTVEQLLKDHK